MAASSRKESGREVTKVVIVSWLISLPFLGLVWLTGDRRMTAFYWERSVERGSSAVKQMI